MRTILTLLFVATLGCVKPAVVGEQRQSAEPSKSMPSPATPSAKPVSFEAKTDVLDFAYAWPAEAAAISALDARFRNDMATARAEVLINAREDARTAAADKREFHPHDFSRSWTTAGETGRLLSLENTTGFFTGGAHPNHGVGSLLWDRGAGREIGVADLFDSPNRFAELVTFAYCRDLDAERTRRREGQKLEGEFAQCPSLSGLAIVPTDADRNGRFDAIRFIAEPYVAGPYVEGDYDVPLPITAGLVAAMKAEYRSSFEVQRQ